MLHPNKELTWGGVKISPSLAMPAAKGRSHGVKNRQFHIEIYSFFPCFTWWVPAGYHGKTNFFCITHCFLHFVSVPPKTPKSGNACSQGAFTHGVKNWQFHIEIYLLPPVFTWWVPSGYHDKTILLLGHNPSFLILCKHSSKDTSKEFRRRFLGRW
jgi:hypothetical protein